MLVCLQKNAKLSRDATNLDCTFVLIDCSHSSGQQSGHGNMVLASRGHGL